MSGPDTSRREVIQLLDARLEHPRGGPPLLAGASLGIAAGEVALVVGAAGVGTSRLVAAALGEIALAGGTLEVLGRDVSKLRRSSLRLLRRRVGVVPQDLCLLEDRSAQLNVVLPLEIDGIPRSASIVRAAQVLAQLGLESEASLPVDCLGAAARQRVAVARALVREPDLVIADHPTSAQDAAGAELVCTALAIAAARGAAVLVLGRDPALLELATRHRWRRFALVDGLLVSATEIEPELLDVIDEPMSAPIAEPALADHGNLVPFPIAAGGVA